MIVYYLFVSAVLLGTTHNEEMCKAWDSLPDKSCIVAHTL